MNKIIVAAAAGLLVLSAGAACLAFCPRPGAAPRPTGREFQACVDRASLSRDDAEVRRILDECAALGRGMPGAGPK